jgi:hypothetical protein
MIVKQLSVLLPNIPGIFARLSNVLDNEGINIKAVSSASTSENAMVRLVVSDPDRTAAILETFGFNCEVTPVLAAEVPLHPGGINAILKPLAAADVNIHYIYTTINRIGRETIVVLGVDRIEDARNALRQNWITLIGDEIYSL